MCTDGNIRKGPPDWEEVTAFSVECPFALTHDMTLCPAPSPSHADPTLQPSYFTSSLYTEALRQDIVDFVTAFHEQFVARNESETPFAAFKRVWRAQRWHLLHFRVFDDRARERFLNVTCRVFLGECSFLLAVHGRLMYT